MSVQRFRDEETMTVPRFDSESVRRVLARASDIDAQAEQETLTVAQVEALGLELGLPPNAVRRALGEVAGTNCHNRQALTQEEVKAALIPGFAYLTAIGLTLLWWQTVRTGDPVLGNLAVALLYTVLYLVPVLSALVYGWRKGDARLGMIAGGGMCLSWALTASLVAVFQGSPGPILIAFLLITLLGVSLGAVGAVVRKRWDRLPRHSDR